MLEAVGEAGMATPGDALMVREAAGALALEVEQALRQGILVVEGGSRNQQEHEDNRSTPPSKVHIFRSPAARIAS